MMTIQVDGREVVLTEAQAEIVRAAVQAARQAGDRVEIACFDGFASLLFVGDVPLGLKSTPD